MAKRPEDMTDDELNAALIGGEGSEYETMSNEDLDAELIKEEAVREPTLEEKYLQPIYDVGDKLKYIDKPRSAILGPVIQAVTGGSPIETIKKEYTSWEPQPESSFTGRFREVFKEQKPIMDQPYEDVKQGEGIKALAKAALRSQFPKAYDVMSNVVPSDIPGIVLDELTLSPLPKIGRQKNISSLESAAELNREKGLQRVMTLGAKDASEAANTLKTKKVSNTLERYGVGNLISDPVKLNEKINGQMVLKVDQMGREIPSKVSPGIIDDLTREVKGGASSFSETMAPVNAEEIAGYVYSKLSNESADKNSLVAFGERERGKLLRDVTQTIKPAGETAERTFQDLIEIKRNAADAIYEIKKNPEVFGVEGPTKTKMYKAVWEWVDDYVTKKGMEDPNMKSFVLANSDLSDMLTARDMLFGAKSESLTSTGALDVLSGVATGGALGLATGHPVTGMSVGGGLGAARAATTSFERTMPARMANVQQRAADFLRSRGQPLELNALESGFAVNVPNIQQQVMMKKNLVENIADFEIPRETQEILKNKDLMLAKIAQVTNDPAMIGMLQDALTKHPDKLESVIATMSVQFPNLFVADKYNRVNNKIFHPDPMVRQMMIQKAYKDIENKAMNNTEKIMLQNGLNRDGSLPQSFQ